MAILITPTTKILIQGITGEFGARHARLSLDYGTAGRRRRHPGQGRPVLRTQRPQGADLQLRRRRRQGHRRHRLRHLRAAAVRGRRHPRVRRRRPRPRRRDHRGHSDQGHGPREARHAGQAAPASSAPTAPASSPRPGPDSKGGCRIGIAPGYINKQGHVGVVSRSGTLTYEAVFQLTSKGIGQSTCRRHRRRSRQRHLHLDVIKLFNADPETHGIILIGEIGGNAEVEAARWIKANCTKPVAGFIAGATAPAGRRMGHAGADRRRRRGHRRRQDRRLQGMRHRGRRHPSRHGRRPPPRRQGQGCDAVKSNR
jgi:succinyl-CoA synthetase alpha subunit